MKETRKILTETELPIPLPSTDTGWKDMRQRLEDEMPDAIPVVGNKPASSSKRLLLLLFLLIPTAIWIIHSIQKIKTTSIANTNQQGTATHVDSNLSAQQTRDNNDDLRENDNDTLQRNSSVANNDVSLLNSTNENNNLISIAPSSSINNGVKSLPRTRSGVKNQKADPGSKARPRLDPGSKIKKQSSKKTNTGVYTNDYSNALTSSDASLTSVAIASENTNNPINPQNPENPSLNYPGNPGNSGYAGLPNPPNPPNPQNPSWRFEGGLYWPLQLPTAAPGAYFTGTTGNAQAYRVLIPGAWIQAETEKHLMTLELNPFFTNLVPSKAFKTETTMSSTPDTIVTTVQTKSLLKLFGTNAGFGYAYNVSGNWWMGGSVQAYWWRNAVASTTGEVQMKPVNGSPGTVTPFKSNYPVSDEWTYFSTFQLYLNAEALYKKPSWQGGVRLGIAVTPLSKDEGPSYPLRMELFYRLRLFTLKNKAQTNWAQ